MGDFGRLEIGTAISAGNTLLEILCLEHSAGNILPGNIDTSVHIGVIK